MTKVLAKINQINENTSVPLKVVPPLIAVVVTSTLWLSAKFSAQEARDAAMQTQLTNVAAKLDGVWTTRDQELWATKMQAANPSLNVPRATDGYVRSVGRPMVHAREVRSE